MLTSHCRANATRLQPQGNTGQALDDAASSSGLPNNIRRYEHEEHDMLAGTGGIGTVVVERKSIRNQRGSLFICFLESCFHYL